MARPKSNFIGSDVGLVVPKATVTPRGKFNPNARAYPPVEGESFDYAGAFNEVAPFISNAVNSFRTLPGVPTPTLEQTVNPNLVSYDAQRASNARTLRASQRGVNSSFADPQIAAAINAATLDQSINQNNVLTQNEGNTNAQILNQNNQFNSSIRARNTERLNEYKGNQVNRNVAQQELQSANLANFSDKYQTRQRDKAMQTLEEQKLDILPELYKDTGVLERNLYENYLGEYKTKRKGKFGGYIK